MAKSAAARKERGRTSDPRPRLKLVDKTYDEIPGDESLTREAMAGWTEGQRRCRARRRHGWKPFTVYEYRNHYEVIERCPDCLNRRVADFSLTGRKLSPWRPDKYRDGYLLPKGAMRVVEELHDELMLGDILSRRIVEAPDPDDDE